MMDHLLLISATQAGYDAAKSTMCTTTDLGLHPQPDIAFPKPKHCPVNGFGGSWYNQPFGLVPVYNRGAHGVNDHITWAAIDEWVTAVVSNVWCTTGTCLGLCLAVLAYIIALTPNKKRGMPFHTSLILALVFEIGRLLCDMGRASSTELSPYSAYLGLTNDFAATTYSASFQGLEISGMICANLAFVFTVVCLYIQASGLLTGLHLRWQHLYVSIMTYLVGTSLVALALRITITVVQALYTTESLQKFPLTTFYNLRRATAIAYAISLGSWCSVSLVSVFWLMFTRSKLIASNRPYDTALTILSLVFMESFVLPMVFIILQAFPSANFPLPELVVIPSVLALLPMGSLFMTVHTAETMASVNRADDMPPDAPSDPLPSELESRPLAANSQSSTVMKSYPMSTPSNSSRAAPLSSNPVDRELRAIDSMENEEEEPVFGSADTDTVLSYRARKVKRALEARSITPASSKAEIV